MNYYLFIPFSFILIMFIPVKFKLKFSCNLLNKNGAIGVFLFNKKLLHQRFWLKNGKILLQDEDEISSMEIEFDSKEVIFLDVFSKQIKNKTHIKDLYLFYNIGLGDAFSSAIFAGVINLICFIFFTNLKNSRATTSMCVYDTVSYNRQILEFALKTSISISFFDVVYSFFVSLIITSRIAKQKILQKSEQEVSK